MTYNPWPIGKLPQHLRRPELGQLIDAGYTDWDDPREVITIFENKVAEFAGSKYAVAVDCCTHAIELSIRYLMKIRKIDFGDKVYIPKHTYISIPMMLSRLNFRVKFCDQKWKGKYSIMFGPYESVVDGAVNWEKAMYVLSNLHCLSFQIKKRIPIGRGGMVLTDDKDAADWIRLAAYDGRELNTPYDSPNHVRFPGFHYYMTPEDAARGILLMDAITDEGDSGSWENYPDCSKMLNF